LSGCTCADSFIGQPEPRLQAVVDNNRVNAARPKTNKKDDFFIFKASFNLKSWGKVEQYPRQMPSLHEKANKIRHFSA
jgi:hypothetical protein